MAFLIDSLLQYSTVALIAGCSGVGACFLTTHDEEETGRFIQLTKEIKDELSEELKESIRTQTADCLNKERERLEPIVFRNGWNYQTWREDYTPKYSQCVDVIEFGDVLEGLYAKGKEQLLSSSVI